MNERLHLHQPCTSSRCFDSDTRHCGQCGGPWPCLTVRESGRADRPRIASPEHAAAYPLRLAVIRDLNAEGWPEWTVYLGTQDISTHATHAEAITAATELARKENPS